MKLGRLISLLSVIGVLLGGMPATSASANGALERLTCDVPPIVFGQGPGQGPGEEVIWAVDPATGDLLWQYVTSVSQSWFDIGQDPLGRLFLISSGGDLYRIDGSPGTEFDPGSGAVTPVAAIVLPAAEAAIASINFSMLAFDKYGFGYFIADADEEEYGDFLVRFDPDATPNGDGEIVAEIVVGGLQQKGLPSGSASGDLFITNSTAYLAWSGDGLELAFIGLADTGSAYVYDPAKGAGSLGTIDDFDGFGTAATGGRIFIGDGDTFSEFFINGSAISVGDGIDAPSDVYGLTGNGEAIFDECFSLGGSFAPVSLPVGLVCTPDPVVAGGLVTCEITNGPSDGDILWRAGNGSFFAGQGVRIGPDGRATFTFTAPLALRGQAILVELVDWGVTATVRVLDIVPARIPAGEGVPTAPIALTLGAVVLLAAGAATRMRRTGGVPA